MTELIKTPEWVKHAVFYQIFPDRFARSLRTTHPRGITLKPWGSPPEEQGYQGGDLRGITDKLDYLQSLGIDALYLNPIFSSASNHRYHTFDYMQVDPLLGGNEALRELLDSAHARGMRIVLDGVFNHASRGFWAFHHILENGSNSPYLDWFVIEDWPLRPYDNGADKPMNYRGWIGLPALPEFNTDNPGVRDYIFEVARHWIDFGIDGWRLDVPVDIDDDSFWQEFRRVVKNANPEAYICGEIWFPAMRWLQGDQFDAVMNYIFTRQVIPYFGARSLRTDWKHEHLPMKPLDAPTFAKGIDAMHALYDWQVNFAQLNLIDSHDMPRALYLLGEDRQALRLAVLAQMTMPGAPCIYYGDEVGLSAGGDPYCREAFPWQVEESWDQSLLAFYRQAITLRHQFPILRTGSFQSIFAEKMVYAFQRQLDSQIAVVIFNAGKEVAECQLQVDEAIPRLNQAWPAGDSCRFTQDHGMIGASLLPQSALVLIS